MTGTRGGDSGSGGKPQRDVGVRQFAELVIVLLAALAALSSWVLIPHRVNALEDQATAAQERRDFLTESVADLRTDVEVIKRDVSWIRRELADYMARHGEPPK